MNIPQLEPRLTSIPEVPKAFGEDGGHFYRYYDALADELDEDMVKSLKSQLDGILIFAGLFAGVNSAFLALTLPDMKADPADDTNALLLQLVTGGNSSIHSADDLPSATFTPSPDIFPVNVLFSLSLTLAIISSFIAVLGQQWLVYYRKRSGGGAEHQRWEQLRRYLGGKRWRLEAILDDILPALLQSSLVIFCVALVVYLRTLSETICYIIAAPMVAALAILFLVAIAASWDKWCPFKSPLSHFLQFIGQFIRNYWPLYYLVLALISIPYFLSVLAASIISRAKHIARKAEQYGAKYIGNRYRVGSSLLESCKTLLGGVFEDVKLAVSPRPGEGAAYLQAVAAKRVLCTSEDFNPLIFTGVNLQAMTKRESVQCLLDEDTVHERLDELGRSREAELASVFSCAFPHLLLGSCSTALFVERDTRPLYYKDTSYSKKDEYVVERHPLKKKVDGVWCMIPYSSQNDSMGLFYCFSFLHLLLGEGFDDQSFWQWVDAFVECQPASKLANLTVIKFVACAINVLPPWPDSATGPTAESRRGESIAVGEQRSREAYEPEEDLQGRYLTVQQGMEAFKMIIDVDWEMLVGSPFPKTMEETVCKHAWKSPRCPNKLDVWLLDQLLLRLTGETDEGGWSSVAKASIDLLCRFDEFEDPVANSIITEDTRKDNRLRCTRALSKGLQAVPNDIPYWVSSSLDKLVGHVERLVELGLDQSADSYHASILSTWLEIRDTLGEPSKYRAYMDGSEDLARFEEAYPRLKRAFDAIEAVRKNIPTVPNINGNPADPPSRPIDRVQFDQTGFNNGAAEVATTKSDASAPGTPVPDPLKDKGKGRELTDPGKDGRVQESETSDQHELVADDVSESTDDEKE